MIENENDDENHQLVKQFVMESLCELNTIFDDVEPRASAAVLTLAAVYPQMSETLCKIHLAQVNFEDLTPQSFVEYYMGFDLFEIMCDCGGEDDCWAVRGKYYDLGVQERNMLVPAYMAAVTWVREFHESVFV